MQECYEFRMPVETTPVAEGVVKLTTDEGKRN